MSACIGSEGGSSDGGSGIGSSFAGSAAVSSAAGVAESSGEGLSLGIVLVFSVGSSVTMCWVPAFSASILSSAFVPANPR